MTKKEIEVREREIVEMYQTTDLNIKEVAAEVGLNSTSVGLILKRYHAVKIDEDSDRPANINPCMVSLARLPRCYGQGCYLAGAYCQAFVAMASR